MDTANVSENMRLMLNVLCNVHSGLHICHFNAQSLVNKMDEFRWIFERSKLDIICISETWLNSKYSTAYFALNGFNLYRDDRQNRRHEEVGWLYIQGKHLKLVL